MRHTKHEQQDELHDDKYDIFVVDRISDDVKCSAESNMKCSELSLIYIYYQETNYFNYKKMKKSNY